MNTLLKSVIQKYGGGRFWLVTCQKPPQITLILIHLPNLRITKAWPSTLNQSQTAIYHAISLQLRMFVRVRQPSQAESLISTLNFLRITWKISIGTRLMRTSRIDCQHCHQVRGRSNLSIFALSQLGNFTILEMITARVSFSLVSTDERIARVRRCAGLVFPRSQDGKSLTPYVFSSQPISIWIQENEPQSGGWTGTSRIADVA